MEHSVQIPVSLAEQIRVVMKYRRDAVCRWNPEAETGHIRLPLLSHNGRRGVLSIELPPGSPESTPDLVILRPIELRMRDGGHLNNMTSHAFHVLSGRKDGLVRLCYANSMWSPSVSYLKLVAQATVWWEAYQGHLETGKTINDYVQRLMKTIDVYSRQKMNPTRKDR